MIKALPRFLTKIARGTKSCKKLTTLFPYSIDSSFLALGPHWKECADIIGPNKNEVHLQTSYPILRAIFFFLFPTFLLQQPYDEGRAKVH